MAPHLPRALHPPLSSSLRGLTPGSRHRMVVYSGDSNRSAVLYDSLRADSVPFEGVISDDSSIRIDFLAEEPAASTAFNIRFEGDALLWDGGLWDGGQPPALGTLLSPWCCQNAWRAEPPYGCRSSRECISQARKRKRAGSMTGSNPREGCSANTAVAAQRMHY